MTFKWENYLKIADELNIHAKTHVSAEACFRSAISRSYYAVYCKARNRLLSEGFVFNTDRDSNGKHKQVSDEFKLSGDTIRIKIGVDLKRLRRYRNDADYKDNFPDILEKQSKYALKTASRIIIDLKII